MSRTGTVAPTDSKPAGAPRRCGRALGGAVALALLANALLAGGCLAARSGTGGPGGAGGDGDADDAGPDSRPDADDASPDADDAGPDADDAEPDAGDECRGPGDCDDGIDCTAARCASGRCVFEPDDSACDDGIDCTRDLCDPLEGCLHLPDPSACGLPDETCEVEVGCAFVIWVDGACAEAETCGDGSEAMPYERITQALGATADADVAAVSLVRVAPGRYEEGGYEYDEEGKPVVIVGGPGTEWVSSSNTALKVSGLATVELRGIRMTGSHRAIECVDSARCVLERMELVGSTREGLKATGSAFASLDRCLVQDNGQVGLLAEGRAALRLVNCLVVGNGFGAGDAGGLYLKDSGASLVAISSTIADNPQPHAAGAIRAALGAAMTLRGLLLWNNGESSGGECPSCPLGPDSLGGTDPWFVVSEDRSAATDYKIRPGSPAQDLVPVTRGVTPELDYFGEPRLGADGFIDAGADEHDRLAPIPP